MTLRQGYTRIISLETLKVNICQIYGTQRLGCCLMEKVQNVRKKSRSRHSQMSFKIGVLKHFSKFHRKTPVLESLLNKVAGRKA